MATIIDSRAVVSPKAIIGENASIGPFTIVEDDAVIGSGTTIAANALIGRGARIGKDCRIHHGAVVGHEPQDLKYAGEPTTCVIGDRTVIREYATIHRGTGNDGKTVIGADCLLMGCIHIAHDCVLGKNVIMSNVASLAGHVVIEDHVIIGGLTPVHQFVHVGRHSMIGGGLRVPKDVPPFILAGQEPLIFQGLNSVGLRRRGFSDEAIKSLQETYKILYHSGFNISQAVEKIQADDSLTSIPDVQVVLDFIAHSKRGVIAGPRKGR